MSENLAVASTAFDPRGPLRAAHRDRDAARAERDRLFAAQTRARVELERLLDVQREHEAAREADVARFVEARTAALLEGEGGADVAELARPISGTDEAELSREVATARAVEEQLVVKLTAAETVVRRAEAQVLDAAVAILIGHGEAMARELEVGEAECRAKRASLSALAMVWARGRPIPVGRQTHWALTDGDYSYVEPIIGLRAQKAHEIGHVLPRTPPVPNWPAILNRLIADPEAPLE
jgi:hypothetical protein